MLEYGRFKYFIILAVVLLSVLYALPNIYPQDPSVQVTANRGYEVGPELQKQVEATLAEAGVVPKSVEIEEDGELLVRLNDVIAQTKASDAISAAVGDNFVVALNLASTEPEWLGKIGARRMLMGLD